MARTIFSLLRAQAKNFWHYVASNTALQPPLPPSYAASSSFVSCQSSSPATTPSTLLEIERQPSSQLTIGAVCPPQHHCPGQSPKHYLVPENVDSPSWQSISDVDSTELSLSSHLTRPHAPTPPSLQQADSRNQSYEYPRPFNQILVEPGLGKVLLGADLATLLALTVWVNKNESLGLWGRVVCLLLLLSSLALFFAQLVKDLYPVFAMVTVLLGIGCSIAAACTYPLYVFLPHFWVTVLSPVVALSVMTLIMIIFCLKSYKEEV